MSSPVSETVGNRWLGLGSTAIEPSLDYWNYLSTSFPAELVGKLREVSMRRVNEFDPSIFGPAEQGLGTEMLSTFAGDRWVDIEIREEEPAEDGWDHDSDELDRFRTVYVRHLAATRDVDWVVMVHGMNTRGAWQEEFSWYMATTYGRSVPVSIYKYGMIVAGVILFWRRRKLKEGLRDRLLTLSNQAKRQGFTGPPDLIAHSFGTWLVGHILLEEARHPQPELKFGRIILTGSILRPDFDWASVKSSGVVGEVLNHYGSSDIVVPLAQWTIPDSGPSGRRGFDSANVLNVRADGRGHSDLFSPELLQDSYLRVWRPFLTLPAHELCRLQNHQVALKSWRGSSRSIYANLFPVVALPAAISLIGFLLALAGELVASMRQGILTGSIGLATAILVLIAISAGLAGMRNLGG